MANLITRARAIYNLNNRDTTSDEDTTLDALIAAVTKAIENYCARPFSIISFDELYPGSHRPELLLRNFPIASVERVAYAPAPVLRIVNTSASNQRATAKVTATGVELIRVASGVASTSTILFADQATLSALAIAIAALGNGWSAEVLDSNNNLRASADLRAIMGAFPARDAGAVLQLHINELTEFGIDATHGLLTRDAGASWHGGLHYWRIIYRAGYSAVPDDVQEACAQWVAQLFWQTKRDPGLDRESLPGTVARSVLNNMPATVCLLLSPYRNWRV